MLVTHQLLERLAASVLNGPVFVFLMRGQPAFFVQDLPELLRSS